MTTAEATRNRAGERETGNITVSLMTAVVCRALEAAHHEVRPSRVSRLVHRAMRDAGDGTPPRQIVAAVIRAERDRDRVPDERRWATRGFDPTGEAAVRNVDRQRGGAR